MFKYFTRWEKAVPTPRILDAFRDRVPLAEDRMAAPNAAVIDRASVRGAETVGRPRAAMTRARRSTAVIDTSPWKRLGLLLCVVVTGACVQDLDEAKTTAGAPHLLPAHPTRIGRRRLRRQTRARVADTLKLALTIVKRTQTKGFHVLPRRWVLERTLAWNTWHHGCIRDYERLPSRHEAIVRWTVTRITSKQLAKKVQE